MWVVIVAVRYFVRNGDNHPFDRRGPPPRGGGDAETGTGVEVGRGMHYEGDRWLIEGSVRALVVHETDGYEEWERLGMGALSYRSTRMGRRPKQHREGFGAHEH